MLRTGKAPRPSRPRPVPLRVAVLCGRQAPGLGELLATEPGAGFRVVTVIATDPTSTALPEMAEADVPCIVHDIRQFYRERRGRPTDISVRPLYDAATVRLLNVSRPNLLVLSGYRYIVTDPLLDLFPHRVITVHDSDLCLTDENDRPRYPGLRSTRDAIVAGERETRSTVHVVTGDVDAGPPLVRSWAFDVHPMVEEARQWGANGLLNAYAAAQREWMMRAAWGPMLVTAVQMFVLEEVRVLGRRAYLSGIPGPRTLEPEARGARRLPPWRTVVRGVP